MTKSKFKYSTANAGATLFQPKKESKPFAPFDIQAAGQHIIAAKEQNMRTELGNIKRTGDEGAEDFDIAASTQKVTETVLDNIFKYSKGCCSKLENCELILSITRTSLLFERV